MKLSRIPFAAFALINLVIGFWTGLLRMGVDVPVTSTAAHHGAIMVGGFLGTLITLEKVIPFKKRIFYVFPVIGAASIVAFFLGQVVIAVCMQMVAAAGLFLLYLMYLKKDHSPAMVMMTLGSLWWLVGNSMLLHSRFYPTAFSWWLAFIFFTIVGERLELSRFLPVSSFARRLLWSFVLLLPLSIFMPYHSWGRWIAGLSLIAAGIWLLKNDVVRITLRKDGLTKYTGVALLMGYFFLILCGLFFIMADQTLPFTYDMVVHAFFLGFTFCMIFAHGPIILPGVLGSSVKPFHPILYVWLFLLISGTLLRIAGDSLELISLRHISGIVSLTSILAFFPTLGILTRRAARTH